MSSKYNKKTNRNLIPIKLEVNKYEQIKAYNSSSMESQIQFEKLYLGNYSSSNIYDIANREYIMKKVSVCTD